MGKACRGWEVGQIQRAGVCGSHLIAVGKACADRLLGRLDVGDVGTGGEEIACCTGVYNGPFVDGVHVYVDCA